MASKRSPATDRQASWRGRGPCRSSPPSKIPPHPDCVWLTHARRVFANVISSDELMLEVGGPLIEDKCDWKKHTQGEAGQKAQAEMEGAARIAQELGEAGRTLSQSLQREHRPARTSGQTSGLQTKCSFNPRSLWYLLW